MKKDKQTKTVKCLVAFFCWVHKADLLETSSFEISYSQGQYQYNERTS